MRKGFTLIELLIVIVIIAIIAGLAIVGLKSVRGNSRDIKRVADMRQLQTALEIYRNDNDVYPSIITSGLPLVGPNGQTYMESVPSAPGVNDGSCTSDSYVYQTTNPTITYSIDYCLGESVQNISAGSCVAVPGNICLVSASGGRTDWYNSSWSYRTKIVINHTKISNTDQSNFPVLINRTDVNWKDIANSGHIGQADGGDIVFTLANGLTKLDHEVEKYTASTGELVAWVEVPTVSASDDTEIYIYYGNAGVADQWDVTGTWDDGGGNYFKGVWHLKETGVNPTVNDSTANGNNSNINLSDSTTSGQIDGAMDFTSANHDYIEALNSASLAFSRTDAQSAQIWFKQSSVGVRRPLITKQIGSGQFNTSIYVEIFSDNKFYIFLGADSLGNIQVKSVNTYTDTSSWHSFSYTYDGSGSASGIKMYYDGFAISTTIISNTLTTDTMTNSVNFRIGGRNYADIWWNGSLDEVRISKTVRSADWIKTEYNNQSSPATFYSAVSEEAQ